MKVEKALIHFHILELIPESDVGDMHMESASKFEYLAFWAF